MTEIRARESSRGPIAIHAEDGAIARIEALPEAASAAQHDDEDSFELVLPGMIDLQVNGFAGADFMTCSAADFLAARRAMLRCGVTSFLPTLITAEIDVLLTRLAQLAEWIEDSDTRDGSRAIGIHLEGPFLAPEKRGAHPIDAVQAADPELLERFVDAGRGHLRMLTLAPELPGANALLERCKAHGIVPSLGHSASDYRTARAAFARGARLCTHFGNAMPPLHHREPGLQGAVLTNERALLCVIPDGIHVHDSILELASRAKGPRGVVLVSDAIAAAGLPDGEYSLAGQRVTVVDGACRNDEGVLAGSSLRLDRGLSRWARVTDADVHELEAVSSANAAELLGMSELGALRVGARADLVAFRRNKGELSLDACWLGGEIKRTFDSHH